MFQFFYVKIVFFLRRTQVIKQTYTDKYLKIKKAILFSLITVFLAEQQLKTQNNKK